MLKVVIVDDEMMIRIGLQACISWEDYGCQVVAACESAEEAIAFFQADIPDIVFTDIMMPGMNGIELVEYITKRFSKTKVVVLSCINEIDYVKKAIKLGAEDYILKLSFTQDIMRELLVKLLDNIEEERKCEGGGELYSEIYSFNCEEGFRMLMVGEQTLEEQGVLLDRLGYPYNPFESYRAGCFLIDRFRSNREAHCDERHMIQYGLQNMIKEYFVKLPEYKLSFIRESEILILFREMQGENSLLKLGELLALLNNALKTHFNLTLSLGLAESVSDRNKIPENYQRARDLAKLRFFDGCGTFHKDERGKNLPFVTKRSFQKKMQEAVFHQDLEEICKLIEAWFSEMREYCRVEQISNIRRSVIETWYFVSGYSLAEDEEAQSCDELYSTNVFWDAENLEQLKLGFIEGIKTILQYLKVNKTSNPEIGRFLAYLNSHVGENITLDQAASQCALGKSQFCILFKKTTGDTFINYFNGLKMKRAYELLTRENLQVQQVAFQLGMHDLSYFSRMFKKYYQISPSDVKNKKPYDIEI